MLRFAQPGKGAHPVKQASGAACAAREPFVVNERGHGQMRVLRPEFFDQVVFLTKRQKRGAHAPGFPRGLVAAGQRHVLQVSDSDEAPFGARRIASQKFASPDFLVEAEKKGYLIPGNLRNGALNRLAQVARSYQSNSSPFRDSEDLTQAYRLYVLALSRGADLGAMNRLREAKALNVRVKWFLAAAYALAGRTDVANSMLNAAMPLSKWDYTFDRTLGSDLRDEAIQLIALCALDNQREIQTLVSRISETLASDEWLDTQSVAFALIALSDYVNRYPVDKTMLFEYAFDRKSERVKSDKPLWNGELMSQAKRGSIRLTLENKGEATLYARLIVSGQAGQGEELPYENDLSLAVSYVDMNGEPIDITSLAQGDNFVANVTLKNSSFYPVRHVVLSQIFPAGWEILNTRYVRSANPGADEIGIQYQDVRDDRVYSHIDLLPSGRQVAIRVNLCAVYPGRFYLPPVSCEAMYDARIRANTEGQQVEVNMRE